MLQLDVLAAGHLPIIFAMFFTLMLSSTYVFAVWHGDVDPVFPYISSSGDHRPESCFFGMMLNLCSFMTMLIVHLRSFHVQYFDPKIINDCTSLLRIMPKLLLKTRPCLIACAVLEVRKLEGLSF
ncbi:unnamed protein product [Gongylonema pulchrum]|uniref:Aa_trans domain-containing protein n=1 Tax=Gongylonema pulchrum TaxID=637853 RepID=A0A183E9Z6_9BILA|nr:unnamed protein product [Gongylonema pulchrum]